MQISPSQIERLAKYFENKYDKWVRDSQLKFQMNLNTDEIHLLKTSWMHCRHEYGSTMRIYVTDICDQHKDARLAPDSRSVVDTVYMRIDDMMTHSKWKVFAIVFNHELHGLEKTSKSTHISYLYGE